MTRHRVDGYVRVSRIGGRAGDGYISPEVQREQIEAFASLMGVEIDAWHDDQDYSGGNVDRPGFLEVIRRIESGETGGVIVARIDRFARSAPDGGAMVRRILGADAIFASAQERIDPTTDFGKAMLNIMFVMAELQLDQLKSGWKTAKGRAIGRGAHIGPTPFGYLRVPRGQEGSGTLIPDPARAPAVTKLFRHAASGVGVSELARYMDEISPRSDGGLWTTSSIGHLLANRVYLGEVAYGSDDRPLRNPRAHEPLVDAATWQSAQRERRPYKKRGTPYVLSGLVRCAACRYVMAGGPGGTRGQLRVYRCQGRHGGGKCPAPSMVVAERLEAWVIDQVEGLLAGSEVRAERAADTPRARRRRSRRRGGARRVHARPREPRALRIAVRHLSRRPTPCTRGCRGGVPSGHVTRRTAAARATDTGRSCRTTSSTRSSPARSTPCSYAARRNEARPSAIVPASPGAGREKTTSPARAAPSRPSARSRGPTNVRLHAGKCLRRTRSTSIAAPARAAARGSPGRRHAGKSNCSCTLCRRTPRSRRLACSREGAARPRAFSGVRPAPGGTDTSSQCVAAAFP